MPHSARGTRETRRPPFTTVRGTSCSTACWARVLYSYPQGEDEVGADRQLSEIAARLRSNGRKTYIIPLSPGHPPLGALGYVRAAEELLGQAAGMRHKDRRGRRAIGQRAHARRVVLFGLRAYGSTCAGDRCMRASQCAVAADTHSRPVPRDSEAAKHGAPGRRRAMCTW